MSVSYVRQLSDGEELILADRRVPSGIASDDADPRGVFHETKDPREASVERRNQALSHSSGVEASER